MRKWFLAGAIVLTIAALWASGLGHYLSLAALKEQSAALQAQQAAHPWGFVGAFFAVYVLTTALSFPGATILTLAAGALFGTLWGTVLVSFASTLGATVAFLGARYLFRDSLQLRYGGRLKALDKGIEREGAFYLFTLRLVPVVPFFVVNLLMGLTQLPTRTFVWVSQLGMLLGTAAYVNAGTQLSQLSSLRGVLSPGILGAFVLLGVLPLIAKRLVEGLRARKVYRPFRRPKRFDRNLIVIGAGAGGLVSSYIAAAVKAKVTLIEKQRMGGDCLYTGCVPSKALIRAAKSKVEIERAGDFGIAAARPEVDFAAVMRHVQAAVKAIEPHDSVERYTGLGVECLKGHANLIDPWTVEVNGQRLTAPHLVLATGAAPVVPPIPGLAGAHPLTSENLWELTTLPARLVVLGGGPIGCELAQAFARLGSQVTQVEMAPRLMLREDPEVSALVQARFAAEGVDVRVGTRAKAVEGSDREGWQLVCEQAGVESRVGFDRILVAVGRAARLEGFGLQALGLKTGKVIEVDDYGRTSFPNILACGDAAGPFQFTHTASHTAWYAAVNALFGKLLWLRGGLFRIDYSVIPWCTFTAPEVARVGLNETEAREKKIAFEVSRYALDDLDRAIADGETEGFVKVLTVPGKDKILGVTIAGHGAGDLIAEWVLAMRHGIGLNKMLGTIHIYPTFAEANKYAAGVWKQAHKPERILRWLERYHAWQRG